MVRYHDREWGKPVKNDRKIFEFLVLESAQAGLSWLTILKKRDSYRKVFANFEPRLVARFGARDVEKLLKNALHKAILSGEKVTRSHFESALVEATGKRSEPPKGMFA